MVVSVFVVLVFVLIRCVLLFYCVCCAVWDSSFSSCPDYLPEAPLPMSPHL